MALFYTTGMCAALPDTTDKPSPLPPPEVFEEQISQCLKADPFLEHYYEQDARLSARDNVPGSELAYKDRAQDRATTITCAETFSLALNKNCSPPAFSIALKKCNDFSIQQVFWAIQAYYRETLPNTEKMRTLCEKASQHFGKKSSALSQPGSNLASLPGVRNKAYSVNNRWEENTFCALDQKDLWIVQWALAHVTLIGTYVGAMTLKGPPLKKHPAIFDPTCANGAFDPLSFLRLLQDTMTVTPYAFYHMDKEDFVSLGFAWIPGLCHTPTRSLFRTILDRHAPFDPEKEYFQKLLDKITQTLNSCQHGKTAEGFTQLVKDIWDLFDDLGVDISPQQWECSIILLKRIDDAAKHMDNHPEILEFRSRTPHNNTLQETSFSFCIKSLENLVEARHTFLLQHAQAFLQHEEFLRLESDTLYTSTEALAESYQNNYIDVEADPAFRACALLSQQSVLLKALSIARCTIAWQLDFLDHEKNWSDFEVKILDAEISDLKTVVEHMPRKDHFKKLLPLQPSTQNTPWRATMVHSCGQYDYWETQNAEHTRRITDLIVVILGKKD